MNGKILIITNPKDPHSDAVIHFLNKLRAPVVRFHAAECHLDSTIWIRDEDASFVIGSSARRFDCANLRSVWFRRPDAFDNHVKHLAQPDRHLVTQETNATLWGLYGRIDSVWYSHPYNIRKASWKLYQQSVARSVGFTCPDSLISNDSAALTDFAGHYEFVVMKPIDEKTTCFEDDGKAYSLYLKKLTQAQIKACLKSRPISPVWLQRFVRKKCDVRVTVIGSDIFAAAISDPAGREVVDFRPLSLELEYEAISCPLQEQILSYMGRMGLNFAAFDFVVDEEGEWFFLECNPNGQWLWIEIKTRLPLVETLARHLILEAPPLCGLA